MTIIFLIGLAALAIEVADSDLATTLKTLLFIDRERSFLVAASKPKSFFKVLPTWIQYTVIVPIIVFIFNILFYIIRMVVRLINCPFCISMWFGTVFSYAYLGHNIIESICLGGITILITKIIDRYITFK